MVGDDGDLVVGLDEDLEPRDESSRRLEPLGDRLDVLKQRLAVDAREPRDGGDRVGLAVREHRDQLENAAELGGGGVGHGRAEGRNGGMAVGRYASW